MRRSLSIVVPLLIAGCSEATRTLPERPPVPQPAAASRGLEACDASTTWQSPVSLYGWWPRPPRFSPDGTVVTHSAAVYLGGVSFLGVEDGRTLAVTNDEMFDSDRAWQRHLRFEGRGIVVRDGDDELLTIDNARMAMLGPSGDTVIALVREEGPTNLEFWELETNNHGSFQLPQIDGQALIGVDERRVLVLGVADALLIDLEAGIIASRNFGDRSTSSIVGGAAHAGSSRIAITTHDGELFLLSSDDLSILETRRTSVVTVNEDIYAPLLFASPVAWSDDGRLFAFLDETKNVVVEGPEGVLHRIAPLPDDERHVTNGPYAPGALAFSADNERLALAYQGDLAVFSCADATMPAVERGLTVMLEAPSVAETQERISIFVETPGHSAFRAARLEVNGERASYGTRGRELTWIAPPPGTYELRVVVDSGRTWGEAVVNVVVR